ncbi:unnamed protein product [Cyprideis torosa]|uniref:Uncharacterized protein n=1 Tax=Cyprideis torosa TaxID=163714 RepID=A0A7R8WRK1_9CRUS|nr:unnamed protein product [Cyprideis torosa]CAG0907552.1 unnamed protein product [Cyprideis torosa]
METFGRDRDGLQRQRDEVRKAVETARQKLSAIQQDVQQHTIRLESLKSAQTAVEENLSRYEQQIEQASQRLEDLAETELMDDNESVESLEQALEILLAKHVEQEALLEQARASVVQAESQVSDYEALRQQQEQAITEQRSVIQTFNVSLSELKVRIQTFEEQLDQTEFFKSELLDNLDASLTVAGHEQGLEKLQQRISRLGPINLAAIDEYKEQSERKVYLDSQNQDLVTALETLESAIAKIDKESRTRFRDTFERVNASLQDMFPRLFGGGQAYLEMTESDLLSTGVTIMARPPGKRIANIHLMSGGEKALTAVAMVFAIFELNPAPFCMLDEVDAPLDEANVGRFCELVRAMSERVQFIFITHNKTTMELADQLIGVTMREPGVSRQVDVDLAAAASMATG